MYSSVSDLAKLVSLVMSDDKVAKEGTRQILDGASIRETFVHQFLSDFGDDGFV